jgi:hypothetical protein
VQAKKERGRGNAQHERYGEQQRRSRGMQDEAAKPLSQGENGRKRSRRLRAAPARDRARCGR